jgi:hypothetical protein
VLHLTQNRHSIAALPHSTASADATDVFNMCQYIYIELLTAFKGFIIAVGGPIYSKSTNQFSFTPAKLAVMEKVNGVLTFLLQQIDPGSVLLY